jgi:phosphate starvation-inducible PhoH-like protein
VPKLSFEIPAIPLVELLGSQDRLLRKLENLFPNTTIHNRGHQFTLEGEKSDLDRIKQTLLQLAELIRQGITLDDRLVSETARIIGDSSDPTRILAEGAIKTPNKVVRAKTVGQKNYLDAIDKHTITFGIGPAGTGKTYLAVAKSVAALYNKQVSRIILTRPAVEAGERLGFLPGTLSEKIDPYLRPLFDALQEMLEPEATNKLMEAGVIEVAPLAYMRGRTLNDSFIILDEAQNTTAEQMKMFLTRLGFGSKMVVTGDATQIDLPTGKSGLDVATKILKDVDDLHVARLSSKDVVRHELVTRIVDAYEKAGNK